MKRNVICDTSVVINFLKVKRLDLLEKHPSVFWVTDHVHDEVTSFYSEQRILFDMGLDKSIFQKTIVDDPRELAFFAELHRTKQLGAGECAAIAVAYFRSFTLAIDDNQAIKTALPLLSNKRIIRTEDLILEMIQEQVLDVEEADHLLHLWSTEHRYKLIIKSFSDLLASRNHSQH